MHLKQKVVKTRCNCWICDRNKTEKSGLGVGVEGEEIVEGYATFTPPTFKTVEEIGEL